MILITGGAGYIGSHINKLLTQQGHDTLVYDNLVYGHREAVRWGRFIEGDLGDTARLDAVFAAHPIDMVFHFAAYTYVGESVQDPAKYYANNVGCTLTLLDAMRRHNVRRIVFSSTCATFGEPDRMPITEDMPQNPVNPYGRTKLMMERILADYHAAYGIDAACLRYFNAAGASPEADIGESHTPETHLIPLVLAAAAGDRQCIKVFGTDWPTRDGSCIRDYVHVTDLADAHLRAMHLLQSKGGVHGINLGSATGTSVLEVIDAARRVTGRDIPVEAAPRRAGDPAQLLGSPEYAKQVLGWTPQHGSIDEIVADAWRWYINKTF